MAEMFSQPIKMVVRHVESILNILSSVSESSFTLSIFNIELI